MSTWLSSALGGLGDLVFPRSCVSCASVVEESGFRHLCRSCAARIQYVQDPCCTTCGHPFFGDVDGERTCPHCEGLHPVFRTGRTAVLCVGPVRDLVHELKYRNGQHVAADIRVVFSSSEDVLALVRDAVLVPVPLHPRKRRERGYNQTEIIARELAAAAGGNARVGLLLERVVDTPSQTAFDRRTRLANLKNAFALRPGADITAEHHYVLVDDVFTTGSTLNSCARVLRHAGVLNLDVVTFGHG